MPLHATTVGNRDRDLLTFAGMSIHKVACEHGPYDIVVAGRAMCHLSRDSRIVKQPAAGHRALDKAAHR